jgi:hypothetical protein
MAYPVSGSPYLGASASPAFTGIFIPAIWAGKFIEKFYDATVLGAIASTDYEGEIKNFGDTVYIRTHPAININAYSVDQALSVQRPSSNLVTLSINAGAYFNTVLDDVMEIQADIDLLSVWADNASEQMKVYVDTVILAVASIGNQVTGATTIITSNGGTQNMGYPAGRISASLNLGASTNSTIFVGASKYFGPRLDDLRRGLGDRLQRCRCRHDAARRARYPRLHHRRRPRVGRAALPGDGPLDRAAGMGRGHDQAQRLPAGVPDR